MFIEVLRFVFDLCRESQGPFQKQGTHWIHPASLPEFPDFHLFGKTTLVGKQQVFFGGATQEVSRSGLFPPSRPIPKDPRSGFRRGPGEPGALRRPGAGGGGGHAGGDFSGGSTPPGETRAPFPALAPASASIC